MSGRNSGRSNRTSVDSRRFLNRTPVPTVNFVMPEDWRQLKVGDRVRIVRLPSEFSQPGFHVDNDTVSFYRHLIDSGCVLKVTEIDPKGRPRIEYEWKKLTGIESHGLLINDDSWEAV